MLWKEKVKTLGVDLSKIKEKSSFKKIYNRTIKQRRVILQKAYESTNKIQNLFWKAIALFEVATAQAQVNLQAANNIFKEAYEVVNELWGFAIKTRSL